MSELANRYKKNNFNLDQSTRGYILRIGNRKSSNFYPIYQTKKGLRFVLEMKKNQIKKFLTVKIMFIKRNYAKYFEWFKCTL